MAIPASDVEVLVEVKDHVRAALEVLYLARAKGQALGPVAGHCIADLASVLDRLSKAFQVVEA